MRPTTVLLLLGTQCIITEGNLDWCEYWTKMGKKDERPECARYILPEDRQHRRVQQTPVRSRNPAISPSRCDSTEMLGCPECESKCDQERKHCEKRRCPKRICICRGDLYRDFLGNCVDTCPRNVTSVFSSMKQMVPLLLKDMWRSVFRAFKTSTSTKQIIHMGNNVTFIPA